MMPSTSGDFRKMMQFNPVILYRRTLGLTVVFFGYYKTHTILDALI